MKRQKSTEVPKTNKKTVLDVYDTQLYKLLILNYDMESRK